VIDFEERVPFITDNVITSRIFETDSGIFKFADSHRFVFREKMSWFSFKLHTPFPLKGNGTFKNGMAHVEGRLPLSTTIFIGAWLVGITAGGILLGIKGSNFNFIPSMIVLLIGWGIASALYFSSVALEKKRLFNVYDEIKREIKY
jgi:hypothetical protein